MQPLARAIALACTLVLVAPAVAAERGWTVDVRAGHIEGPGMTNKELDLLRRIDGIDEGRRLGLGLQWESGGPWYLRGTYSRSELRYESPLNPACPAVVNRFLPPRTLCQAITPPREGWIEDRHGQLDFVFGYRLGLTDWLDGVAELGYGVSRWHSSDDVEATATARCLAFSVGVGFYRQPDCQQVVRRAHADGIVAGLGVELWRTSRLSLAATLRHQAFRYRIYRNDLYPRFASANGVNQGPGSGIDTLVAREPPGSWTWGALQARYALTPRLSVLLQVEGLGNRDWETVDLGLRFRL